MMIWHKLFNIEDIKQSPHVREWEVFFGSCWLTYYLLRPEHRDWINGKGNMFYPYSMEQTLIRYGYDTNARTHCIRDDTLLTASNLLHTSVYGYLWGRSGSTIFLRPKVGASNVPIASIISDLEKKLQDIVTKDVRFNRIISVVLKNALDFGVGYVSRLDGFYEDVPPYSVLKGLSQLKREPFYVVDCGMTYMVFGQQGEVSGILKLKPEKKYFAARFDKGGEKCSVVYSSNFPLLHVLEFDFFKTDSFTPVGCGMVASESVLRVNCLLNRAYNSQVCELQPPVGVSSLNDNEVELDSASKTEYDSTKMTASEVASVLLPARGANSLSFVDFWRSSIRRAYFLDQAVARGVGQQTAADAARNAAAAAGIFSSTVYPFFNGFLHGMLRAYIEDFFRPTLTKTDKALLDFDRLDMSFIGAFTNDVANSDMGYVNTVGQVMSVLSQFDKEVLFLVDAAEIARKIVSDLLPSGFYRTEAEYEEIVRRFRDSQREAAQAALEMRQQNNNETATER